MTFFTIDSDNNITAFASAPAAIAGTEIFSTRKQLAGLAANWPIAKLVETWNSFAGAPPFGALKAVKRFENREKAVTRIWKACEVLAASPSAEQATATLASAAPQRLQVAPKTARPRKKARGTPAARDSKKAAL